MRRCEACERGDHANCSMQAWCECGCDPDFYFLDKIRLGEDDFASEQKETDQLNYNLAIESARADKAEEKLAQAREENDRLREFVAGISKGGTYESEYDGRTYEFCIGCDADIEKGIHDSGCSVIEARKLLCANQDGPQGGDK